MKDNRVVYFSQILLLIVSIITCSLEFGVHSYLIYGIITVWGIGNLTSKVTYNNFIVAMMFIVCVGCLRIWDYSARMLMNIMLSFIGILPFLNNKNICVKVWVLNFIAIIIFVIINASTQQSLSMSAIINSMIFSDLETESSMLSFIFPLFSLHYLVNDRNLKLYFLNFLFTIIAGKRIALLALVLASLAFIIFSKREKMYNRLIPYITTCAIIFNLAYLYISYLLASGGLDDLISYYTGLSSNAFTMGRENIYGNIFSYFDSSNLSSFFFGIGSVSNYMERQLHNDILKIFLENGIIVFCVYFFILYRKVEINILPFLIYINILFMTDNTLIYVPVIYFMCFFTKIQKSHIHN